jgi:branched-chain amino acid transport system substrate-binding protein
MTPSRTVITRSVTLLVLVAGCIGLAACGGSGSSGTGSGPVAIGASVPLTGAQAAFGSYISWGYEHAVNTVNSQGGVMAGARKHKVKLILLDDQSDPNTDANNVEQLITRDHVAGLLGSCTPPLVDAGALVAERNRIPMVTGCNPVDEFAAIRKWTYVWDLFFSERASVEVPFMTLQDQHKQSNHLVAVLHDNDPSGLLVGRLVPTIAAQYGYRVVLDDSFPVDATTFTSEIAQTTASHADVVIVLAVPPTAIAMRKQMATAGLHPKYLTMLEGAEPAQFAKALGPLADGVTVTGYWDPDLPYPGAKALATLYTEQTGHTPSQHLADSTTAAEVLLDAINRANSTDPAKVNAQIANTNKTYVIGPVHFAADHTDAIPPVEGQWQNGRYVVVGPRPSEAQAPFIYPLP